LNNNQVYGNCQKCGKLDTLNRLGDFGSAKAYYLCFECGTEWNKKMNSIRKLRRILDSQGKQEKVLAYSIVWEVEIERWLNPVVKVKLT